MVEKLGKTALLRIQEKAVGHLLSILYNSMQLHLQCESANVQLVA